MDGKKELKRAETAMKAALKKVKQEKSKRSSQSTEKPKVSVTSSVI